jgi:hypothetical protein
MSIQYVFEKPAGHGPSWAEWAMAAVLLVAVLLLFSSCATAERVTPQRDRPAIIEYQFWPTL